MYSQHLTEKILKLRSLISYGQYIHKLARFLNDKHPNIKSFYDLPYQKTMNAWEKYPTDSGLKQQVNFISAFSRILKFYHEFYDDINEYDKDIWNAKRLSGILPGGGFPTS